MKIKYRYLYITLIIFLVGYTTGHYISSNIMQKKIDGYFAKLEEIVRSNLIKNTWLNYIEIEDIQINGVEDKVAFIKNDLIQRTDLITYEPVLGGKMGFYSEESIYVISNKWVLALFEDGHINGGILLKYTIRDDKKIDWTILDSYLF